MGLIHMNTFLRTKSIIAFVSGALTFIVYLPTLQNQFINWDDVDYVYANYFIRSLDAQLLRSAFAEFHVGNWHPLTWLSHAFDYALWGLNPLGHHLTSNILHALNTILVVFLAMQLLEVCSSAAPNDDAQMQRSLSGSVPIIAGAVTGLLFGLHPVHVESVAWVSERKDLLFALFYLLSIITYIRYTRVFNQDTPTNYIKRYSNKIYLLTLGSFVLSLLSKPMAVTLPAVLLILDWYPFRRIRSFKTLWESFAEKFPFFVLALVSSSLTIMAQRTGGALKTLDVIPLASRILIAVKSLIDYLGKMLLPVNLLPYYAYPKEIDLLSFEYIVPLLCVIAITAVCIAIARSNKLWISVWGYYIVTLMPVLGIVQVGDQSMADRYTYLPSLGPFFIVGFMAAKGYEKILKLDQWKMMSRTVSILIATTMVTGLSYATHKQISIWKDSFVFWNYIIKNEPPNIPFAHNNLGNAYLSRGLADLAIAQYRTAINMKPDFEKVYSNLGNAYLSKGQIDMAIEHYQAAIRLKPDLAEAYSNLGNAYLSKNQPDMAIAQYNTAVKLKPHYADAYRNLGVAYLSKGQTELAIEHYQTALRLIPHYAEAYFDLGNVYASISQFDKAVQQYRTAVNLTPNHVEAHFNLGLSYLKTGSKELARKEFEIVLSLNPNDTDARKVLDSMNPR